jgi:hypothetical protein
MHAHAPDELDGKSLDDQKLADTDWYLLALDQVYAPASGSFLRTGLPDLPEGGEPAAGGGAAAEPPVSPGSRLYQRPGRGARV